MSKKLSLTFIMAILALAAAFVIAADEKPWLDFNNCDFCKPWMSSGLMSEMTHEMVPMKNGVMTVMTCPEKRMAEFKKTSAMMNEIGAKAGKGEPVKMCGSCEAMGGLLMRGAQMEEVWLKSGSVMLMTSSDPALVADMHKWAQKNIEEYAKMPAPTPAAAPKADTK